MSELEAAKRVTIKGRIPVIDTDPYYPGEFVIADDGKRRGSGRHYLDKDGDWLWCRPDYWPSREAAQAFIDEHADKSEQQPSVTQPVGCKLAVESKDAPTAFSQEAKLRRVWLAHVEATEQCNAAIPKLDATAAERELYRERWRCKTAAEDAWISTAIHFAMEVANFQGKAVPQGDTQDLERHVSEMKMVLDDCCDNETEIEKIAEPQVADARIAYKSLGLAAHDHTPAEMINNIAEMWSFDQEKLDSARQKFRDSERQVAELLPRAKELDQANLERDKSSYASISWSAPETIRNLSKMIAELRAENEQLRERLEQVLGSMQKKTNSSSGAAAEGASDERRG